MICNRELEKMSGDTFVSEDWPRIFNCCANIKILRVRIIRRNEKETCRILVVNAGWIHEAPRAGRLKRFGQLSNLEWPKVIGQRDKVVLLQEVDHSRLSAFVRFQK